MTTSKQSPRLGRVELDGDSTVTHLVGDMRFDVELESWLNSKGWRVKNNLLSGEPEVHFPDHIEPVSDERLSEIRFSFVWAKNGKEPAKDKIVDAVGLIAERRAYHPVRDYLASLEWDGVARLDTWLIRYAGADDTPLNRAFSRKFLCAAVRRAKQPGCKFDAMLVLQGDQGIGKSSLLRTLCPNDSWFTDQLEIGAPAKETMEKSAGAWLIELPELDGLSKRLAARVKSFITTTHDKARLAYARLPVARGRSFVLAGTTNEVDFLTDTTGNRRWWIVPVSITDIPGLDASRDQLWAEAVAMEPAEALWLDDAGLKEAAEAVTDAAFDGGPWVETLAAAIPSGDMKISAVDAWKLVGFDGHDTINRLTNQHHTNMRAAMKALGFERNRNSLRRHGKKISAWVRGNPARDTWWMPGDPAPRPSDLGDRW